MANVTYEGCPVVYFKVSSYFHYSLPVCRRSWFLNVDDWLNLRLQNLHTNGFSRVWMRMCDLRLLWELKPRLHNTQCHLKQGAGFEPQTCCFVCTDVTSERETCINKYVHNYRHSDTFTHNTPSRGLVIKFPHSAFIYNVYARMRLSMFNACVHVFYNETQI